MSHLLRLKLFRRYRKLFERWRGLCQEKLAELPRAAWQADKPRGSRRDSVHFRLEVRRVVEQDLAGMSQPGRFSACVHLPDSKRSTNVSRFTHQYKKVIVSRPLIVVGKA